MNDTVKEEVKDRLPIEEVVGQYVELKRAGKNLKGRSPWGTDRNPSFMVSPEKGTWHDFSANKGGDIFTFIMEVEGISFREALEKLATQAGVELKKYSGTEKAFNKKKARAREALELATRYYQFCLSKNKQVCEYVFYKRNLNKKTVQDFRIGYAPASGKALKTFLEKKGYTEDEMNFAGLLNRFGGDLFRGRMMVPFIDRNGSVIGYTARVLDSSEPKYLNTPETVLFNKSKFIFGLFNAAPTIRQSEFVVIVEGNMDVISSYQSGVANTVATSGTAMTEQHLKILSGLTKDVRLAYDGDDAGIRATERAINLAGNLGINLTVISNYHGAKDPDELIQKDPALWKSAIESRQPAIDWLLEKYEQKLDLFSAQGKKEYSDVALRVLSYLKDPVEKKHYEKLIAKKLDVDVLDLEEKTSLTFSEKPRRRFLKQVKSTPKNSPIAPIEDALKSIMIFGGSASAIIEKDLAGAAFSLDLPDDESALGNLELVFETRYSNWSTAQLEVEAHALTSRWLELKQKEKVAALAATLENSTNDPDSDPNSILREIINLRHST